MLTSSPIVRICQLPLFTVLPLVCFHCTLSRLLCPSTLRYVSHTLRPQVKDLQTARSKAPYKSTAEVDAAIARLQAQVETGSMKIVDEKRALAEITSLRKSRKAVESYDVQQQQIDEERSKADELRKGLDNPEGKALSERYDVIKKELDEIQAEFEKTAGSRNKLIEKRTQLSAQLDDLYGERRERSQAYRDGHDAWYARSQAEREKRQEQQRAEKKAYDDAKRQEQEAVMREEAAMPAFAQEIEDCDVLIAYFDGSSSQAPAKTVAAAPSQVPGTRKLEPRKIEADASFGTQTKKKGEEEDAADSYYVGSSKKGKGKGNKGNKRGKLLALGESPEDSAGAATDGANGDTPVATATSSKSDLKVPVGHLSALYSLSIPPPTSSGDVPRVVDNLKLKKRYFMENQDRKTKERIAEVEKKLGKVDLQSADTAETTAASVPSEA